MAPSRAYYPCYFYFSPPPIRRLILLDEVRIESISLILSLSSNERRTLYMQEDEALWEESRWADGSLVTLLYKPS